MPIMIVFAIAAAALMILYHGASGSLPGYGGVCGDCCRDETLYGGSRPIPGRGVDIASQKRQTGILSVAYPALRMFLARAKDAACP